MPNQFRVQRLTIHTPKYPPPLLAFFLTAPAIAHIYTLSLHDALPIYLQDLKATPEHPATGVVLEAKLDRGRVWLPAQQDRKSTRLNSSHVAISYAVFCLKKKTTLQTTSIATYFTDANNETSAASPPTQ